MYWKLKVWEYGKIKSAEIEMAPLTLFVGDNNSGKSYLMSLLWGIQNLGVGVLLGSDEERIFNSQSVKIKELQIELKDLDGLFIKIESVKGIGGERDYLDFKA